MAVDADRDAILHAQSMFNQKLPSFIFGSTNTTTYRDKSNFIDYQIFSKMRSDLGLLQVTRRGLAHITLLGDPQAIKTESRKLSLDISKAR